MLVIFAGTLCESVIQESNSGFIGSYFVHCVLTAGCVGVSLTANSTSQLLSSPGYPVAYPDNTDCSWTVSTTTGYVIEIEIISMDLEEDWDYLNIYEGATCL